jgi:16S rRNA pseudouridine516 synthase
MHLADILFTQGHGTRRVCAGLIEQGLVHVYQDNSAVAQVFTAQQATDLVANGLRYQVMGVDWTYHDKAYVLLHKPAGYECSHKPGAWPSVYTLLPGPLRVRPNKNAIQGVQAVGRLDQDTTGLLLMSDDGQFIHRLSSPKHHVAKLYQVTCKHAVDDKQIAKLLEGVVLDDSPKPVRAAACVATGELTLDLTLTEGKYHQVKRMIAAVGNRVEGLHRASMGSLGLGDLPVGKWRWLTADEVAALYTA